MNIQMPMLQLSSRTITDKHLKVNVPVVVAGTSEAAKKAMNDQIMALTREMMKSQGYPGDDVQEMDGTFEIKSNERGVLSLSLLNYVFTGGAHGNTIQHSLTFDAETGRSYKLSELFKPGSDYAARLNKLVEAQIKARGLELLEPYPGISANQDFYIADKSLVLYWQLYELLPYVWGFPYFPISVYDIQDIIDEDGPLGVMIS